MNDGSSRRHLLTKYVFIDTEAFRRAGFDWTGKMLSKLVELATEGHLHLLMTEVTKREIASQLREVLAHAAAALKKHEIVLRQAGVEEAVAAIADDKAIAALDAAFEQFLKNTRAINVPLSADLSALFSDYFARRPPFSAKKKSEFPDAVTVASLLAWCANKGATAYVVSRDPDLEACCSASGPLFYAASVADIISQATVSRELHEALERALTESDQLSNELAEQIKGMSLESGRGLSARGYEVSFSGRIDDVNEIRIQAVSVLDQEDQTFTCQIEFEADLRLYLHVEIEGRYHNHGDYELGSSCLTEESIWQFFYAEVVARFDPEDPKAIEFQSVYVHGHSVELKDDIIEHLDR
jgi:hypothetical protein